MKHLDFVCALATRWVEAEDEHTRMELLLELRTKLEAQTEGEVIALLLQALHAEHERAEKEKGHTESWFKQWRDATQPVARQHRAILTPRF